MRKHFITVLVALALVVPVLAADPSALETFTFSNLATNTASSNITTRAIGGYFNAVTIDLSGSETSPTCDVDVVTIKGGSGFGLAQTLLSVDDVTADTAYYPRLLAGTSVGGVATNYYVKYPLIQDKLNVIFSNVNATGITATVHLIIDHESK